MKKIHTFYHGPQSLHDLALSHSDGVVHHPPCLRPSTTGHATLLAFVETPTTGPSSPLDTYGVKYLAYLICQVLVESLAHKKRSINV